MTCGNHRGHAECDRGHDYGLYYDLEKYFPAAIVQHLSSIDEQLDVNRVEDGSDDPARNAEDHEKRKEAGGAGKFPSPLQAGDST